MTTLHSTTGPDRRLVLGVAVVLAGVVAFALYVWSRPTDAAVASTDAEGVDAADGETVPVAGSVSEVAASARTLPPDAGRAPVSAPVGAITAEDLVGLTIAEQAALIGDTDISDGLDLPPPVLTNEPPAPITERPVADPAYVLGQRQAGLDLLDTTLARLDRDADERERSGDATGAQRMRVRIARMTALRARRATEVETLRTGGSLPSSDPEDRARAEGLAEEPPRPPEP